MRAELSHQQAFETFIDPPREFGLIPFWFWNDDLEEGELIRQLHAFHDAGFGGVLPHARVGLSRRVGYLTDEFFRLMRLVVDEAARLGMKVILYDEGSYPSGSACGAVVAENPDYASRAIVLLEEEVSGPHDGFWRPNTGRALMDRHVCTVLGRLSGDGVVDPESLRVLEPHEHDVIRVSVGDGIWKVMSVWDVASGGIVRGVHPDHEVKHATAPPAGDILNPDAVSCFIRLTHDRYYEELGEHFGVTVIAMFTDEPGTLGKDGRRRGAVHPFTPGLVEWLETRWGEDPRPWLPALWVDYGVGSEGFRQRYADAIESRLGEVFYGAQSAWCEAHDIALTGHPAQSNDMSSLRLFQLPGQDIVVRYVEPGEPSALEGAHSVAAKAATSGARLSTRRRILTEVGGAYKWRLTLDELKWLYDWHLVRGNNLISPHAVYYSIRGRRAWESEPDVGLHNVWWPHFQTIATYARRLSWLLADGEQVCDVAILGDGHQLPWRAARRLYESQIDFLYIDDRAVVESRIVDGRLVVGAQRYRVVIIDGGPELADAACEKLAEFGAAGGTVIRYADGDDLAAAVNAVVPADVDLQPANSDLRVIHYRKLGLHLYLLVNEGEGPIAGNLALGVEGKVEVWNALDGSRRAAVAIRSASGTVLNLKLGRRESLVVAVDPAAPVADAAFVEGAVEEEQIAIEEWVVQNEASEAVDLGGLGDWSRQSGWELFSGTLGYQADFTLSKAGAAWVDLGKVGDIAEVVVDGRPAGVRMWSPYRLSLGELEAAGHHLEVRVTNSMANEYEGAQMPSGLMGPVRLTVRR